MTIIVPQPVYVPGYGRVEAGEYQAEQLPDGVVRQLLDGGHALPADEAAEGDKPRKRK